MTNAEASAVDSTAAVSEQGADVPPEKGPAKKGASQKKNAPKAKKTATSAKRKMEANASKEAKPAKKAAAKPAADRANKKAEVIAMMKRAKGATLAEIMEATGWQAHTVRGFVSILGSKGGENIESSKNAAGERSYRITK